MAFWKLGISRHHLRTVAGTLSCLQLSIESSDRRRHLGRSLLPPDWDSLHHFQSFSLSSRPQLPMVSSPRKSGTGCPRVRRTDRHAAPGPHRQHVFLVHRRAIAIKHSRLRKSVSAQTNLTSDCSWTGTALGHGVGSLAADISPATRSNTDSSLSAPWA